MIKRFGQVIKVKPEKLAYYRELHAHPWQSVLDKIHECNIRNYSIFLLNNELLFAYFEYVGENFEEDMQKMAADPETQRWWAETDPCQQPLELKEGEWWHTMEQIFYTK